MPLSNLLALLCAALLIRCARTRDPRLGQTSKLSRPLLRRRVERRVGPTDLLASLMSERRASFTASSVGNASATSGLRRTKLVPARYDSRCLPRTPWPRSPRRYSGRNSSTSVFFIDSPILARHKARIDDPSPIGPLGVGNHQQPTQLGQTKCDIPIFSQ